MTNDEMIAAAINAEAEASGVDQECRKVWALLFGDAACAEYTARFPGAPAERARQVMELAKAWHRQGDANSGIGQGQGALDSSSWPRHYLREQSERKRGAAACFRHSGRRKCRQYDVSLTCVQEAVDYFNKENQETREAAQPGHATRRR